MLETRFTRGTTLIDSYCKESTHSMAITIYPYNGGIPAHPTLSGCSSWVSSKVRNCRITPTTALWKFSDTFYYSQFYYITCFKSRKINLL